MSNIGLSSNLTHVLQSSFLWVERNIYTSIFNIYHIFHIGANEKGLD